MLTRTTTGTFDTQRLNLIDQVLSPVDGVLEKLLNATGPQWQCIAPVVSTEALTLTDQSIRGTRSDCTAALLGFLVRGLVKQGLFPLPDREDIFESVRSLAHKIGRILQSASPMLFPRPLSLTGTNPGFSLDLHNQCSLYPPALETITVVTDPAVIQITFKAEQKQHLDTQARKSGFLASMTPQTVRARAEERSAKVILT
jgi:hypothetical protein